MKSLWNDKESSLFKSPLELRAYTSRLLGLNDNLVLHGGGNTSVKIRENDIFGQENDILYVKGSGYDLKTIPPEGFSPVRLDTLLKLAQLETLSDADMVRELKANMVNPFAPGPSIETILHGLIPLKFVDHTHADAVVIISNTKNGEKELAQIYGDRVLILPYIMPGFILAKQVYEATKNIDWKNLDGIILLHHGIFTFDDDAKKSYERMIELVTKAEEYLQKKGVSESMPKGQVVNPNVEVLSKARKKASEFYNGPLFLKFLNNPEYQGFASLENVKQLTSIGPVTPDHIIHTKKNAVIIDQDPNLDLENYKNDYEAYFKRNPNENLSMLDTAPRFGFLKNQGALVFGPNMKRVQVVSDILAHTVKAIQWGEALGGWAPLGEKDLFEVEYWELEQAKIKKSGARPEFEGKIVLITGAASGIGRATAQAFLEAKAAVIGLDINPEVAGLFKDPHYLGLVCNVTNTSEIKEALNKTVMEFGGLDIIVSNAGNFPKSKKIEDLDSETFVKALDLNLTSHLNLLREAIPFLKNGINPSVLFVGSKNVKAPGPSASAYSVSKAGLAQLARIAALELGPYGIRVNTVHPNQVFDTGLWNEDLLKQRATNYGVSVEEYKKNNILATTISSMDVAMLIKMMSSKSFSKTTGAQIPIDGGNDRVI